MDPKKYTTNISGYRCNADRKKIQVRVEGATNVCKKLCYDDPDCKGYYTKQPAHFNRNTICNLCTGIPKNPTVKRSSNVNDYNIIINRCDENYKLSEDGTKCIHVLTCPVNTYRLDNNCINCPEGQIAPEGSKNIEACNLVGIHLYREKDFGGFHQHLHEDVGYISIGNDNYWVRSFKKDWAADITLDLWDGTCIPLNGIGDISEVPKRNFRNPYGGYHLRGIYVGAVPRGSCKMWVSNPIGDHKLTAVDGASTYKAVFRNSTLTK